MVAEGFFRALDEGGGEFAEDSAIQRQAARNEMRQQQKGAAGRGPAPGGVGAVAQRGGVQDAAFGMQRGARGAIERFGGEQRQGLAQGFKGEAEQLADAFAGDAQLEAGVAQLGFVQGQRGGGLIQAVVEMDGVGQPRGEEQGEPFDEIQRRGVAGHGGAGVGGHAREQRAVVGVELFAGGQWLAKVAERRQSAPAQDGEHAGRQAAGMQGAVAKSVRARKWSARRGHRFGPVEEASSASYSASESSFRARTISRRVWPEARASWTSWATRS